MNVHPKCRRNTNTTVRPAAASASVSPPSNRNAAAASATVIGAGRSKWLADRTFATAHNTAANGNNHARPSHTHHHSVAGGHLPNRTIDPQPAATNPDFTTTASTTGHRRSGRRQASHNPTPSTAHARPRLRHGHNGPDGTIPTQPNQCSGQPTNHTAKPTFHSPAATNTGPVHRGA